VSPHCPPAAPLALQPQQQLQGFVEGRQASKPGTVVVAPGRHRATKVMVRLNQARQWPTRHGRKHYRRVHWPTAYPPMRCNSRHVPCHKVTILVIVAVRVPLGQVQDFQSGWMEYSLLKNSAVSYQK
jgi:hypothetical protein